MESRHETISDDQIKQLYFSVVDASNALLPSHWHQHLEIVYLLQGSMTAYINEVSYELKSGDILVVNPKAIHYTHVKGTGYYYLLQIPSVHLKRICADWELLHFSELLSHGEKQDSLNSRLGAILTELEYLDKRKEKGDNLLFLIKVYELLYLLYTEDSTIISLESKKRTRREFERIEQSMLYVEENYTRQITLAEVANELSITQEHFCRLFKKCTGQTFFTYVNQVRLQHFHQDLLQTDESITFLLNKHGIMNYKVFLRTFKEAYGTTPHKLRKQ